MADQPPAAPEPRHDPAIDVAHRESAVVFDGPRFEVRRAELTTEGGQKVERDVVVPPDAVVILPIMDDGRVVLVRNQRFAVGQTLWELPAGKREAGEDPAKTAARELLEETGYRAKRVTELTWFYPSPGFCTERLTVFRAQGLSFEGQSLEPTEKITVEPRTMDEALALIREGEVHDAKTIAALLFEQSLKSEA